MADLTPFEDDASAEGSAARARMRQATSPR